MGTSLEIEVKLASNDLDRLRRAGFELQLTRERHFEDNWLLDSPDRTIWNLGAALRVRSAHGRGLVTFKGSVINGPESLVKVREEIETRVDDPEKMIRLLERLGYYRAFRYQKYRTAYAVSVAGGIVEVVYDETPMGDFIEIEGDERRVATILAAAGFTADDVIRESYPEMQKLRCDRLGIPLQDLVFDRSGDLGSGAGPGDEML